MHLFGVKTIKAIVSSKLEATMVVVIEHFSSTHTYQSTG